ncbi:MAG: AMP-binding protein [Spongiibacteraceae bacterium]
MIKTLIESARARLGIPASVPFADYDSLLDLFDEAVQRFVDKPAFSSLGHTLSFSDLDRLSARFAVFLQQHPELQPGDRIAVQLPNLIQYPVVVFGAMRAGLIVVNTNPLYKAEEIAHQLNDAGAKALVVLANVACNAAEILAQTSVRLVIVTELADLHPPLQRFVINKAARYLKHMVPSFDIPGAITLRAALRASGEVRELPRHAEAVAVLQYTGGTTGVAKGAMLSHRNLIANTLQGREMFLTYGIRDAEESFVLPLPLYHIYSFTFSMIMMTAGNHCLLIPNPRDLDSMVAAMRKRPFTGLCGLNTLFVSLCDHAGFRALDFSRMKATISGGMALTVAAAKRWQEVTGKPVYEGYGLTEASPVVSVNPGNNNQPGTIGLAVPATELQVIDDENNVLEINQPGELCVRGPQVMLGYWQRAEETANVLDANGWLRTGDIAVIREDGFAKIVDRKKDLIVVSGFKVFPGEIEDVVSQHPDVVLCAAIGVPDEHSGEVVQLYVIKRREALSEQDVRDFCRQHLTNYKVPRHVIFRTDLPKSPVGKVLRRELRDEALQAPEGTAAS